MRRFFTFTLRFVFVLGAAHTILADPLQWDLSTLTFQANSLPPGTVSTGTATGSFTYNADTNSFTTWSIELSGFAGTAVPAGGLLLTSANTSSSCPPCSPTNFYIVDPTFSTGFDFLSLLFAQPLTDAGGTVSMSSGIMALNTPNFGTFFLQGPSSVSSVPEPSSAALTLIISIGFGALFLRRLRHSRPNQWR
jgi:hypothetical protein